MVSRFFCVMEGIRIEIGLQIWYDSRRTIEPEDPDMNYGAIIHTDADAYAISRDEAAILIKTGKDVTGVKLIYDDPYAGGSMGALPWSGGAQAMEPAWELRHHIIWMLRIRPPYKRVQYYFDIEAGEERAIFFEDGFYAPERAFAPGRLPQYFRLPWMNESDIAVSPQWPADTIWYQIFPERFCRGNAGKKRMKLRRWGDHKNIRHDDFYGGDLRGIIDRLAYIADLGVTGIYLTPVMLSDSNHKYNTFDYSLVDPDFGTNEEMRELVDKAHALGLRVMVDAVFNHCGLEFAPWQDVLKNGKASRYADWFFVNEERDLNAERGTEDGRYYSFAFVRYMPKLNTNNPEVQQVLIDCCKRFIAEWNVDGIRYDVGNEVAHSFLKEMRRQLKAVKPDIFLLGEIWHNSLPWMRGDEYDSVMHYPFLQSMQNFWVDGDATSRDFMYAMNRCLTLYPQQLTRTLFTFLDTHDVLRARTRVGSEDTFFQQMTLLLTMPGSPSLYYGTEIAMEGSWDPDNRRTMPWEEIEAGRHDAVMAQVKALIALRKAYGELRGDGVKFIHDKDHPRLIAFERGDGESGKRLLVMVNAGELAAALPAGKLLYGRKAENGRLLPDGTAILEV